MIYFVLDNNSLSVFTESSTRQNLSLAFKAKLHSSITSTINNSKKLNSIIARALDEISEEISLANNLASIIIDDSILSHSIIIKSKKYDNIDQQIREESQLKWGDKASNYYFVSEEKKTPKNIFHSVAIHHFLREKIKLNFNNFGLSIRYIVPLSSILTESLKPSQFSVIKNGNKYQFLGNTRKGFTFFKLNFSGDRKVEEKVIGLLDIPNIKKSDLDKKNLKFIFFNKTKIVEYLANYIFNDIPLLNFAESSSFQILSGKLKVKTHAYSPSSGEFKYDSLVKNLSAGFLSILFLLFVVSMFSNYDFLNFENPSTLNEKKESVDEIIEKRFTPNTSMIMIQNLLTLDDRFSEVTNFLLLENEFIINGNKMEYDLPNSYPVFSEDRANFNELLISLFEIENNLKFKVFDSEVHDQSFQNVVLKFSNFENSLNALSILSKFENISLRKAFLEDDSNSVHLYISIKK
ncbi:MAG: hypothetical protein ISQ72_01540 [Candidatus Marinimicrobia bacterium]|nr:hypothetical protein [Candidatus Neomarinimicrobiota bacterium]MBL6826675.1 hypothetical protein [Candidatus Neomarinimicrobiota bacterium]